MVKQIFQDSDSPLLEIKKDINSELWSDIPLVTAVIEHVNEVKAVSSAYFGDKIPCLIYHDRFPSASKLGIGDFQEVCPLESMNGNVSFAIVVKECTGSPSADFYRQFQTGVISYIDPQNEYCFIKTEIGIEAFVSPSIFKSINSSSEADFSGSLLKKWSSESNSFKWSVLELNQNDV